MSLVSLYKELAAVFDGSIDIEQHAREGLLAAASTARFSGESPELPQPFIDVLLEMDAHSICRLIAQTPLPWAPPQTSDDELYIALNSFKAHVELLGPGGVVKSSTLRIGLYGQLPNSEYGIRTHPAEEIYVMLAGEAYWKRANAPFVKHGNGERSYHPSMMEHASKTGDKAFMSVYAWYGDISTDNYAYLG